MKISTAGIIRGIINPIIATIHQEINGEFSCFVSIPISDSLAEYFEIDAIIYLVDADGSEQQFRLQKPERTLSELTAFGWHVSQDLANDIIMNRYWANESGADVWTELLQAGISETRFSGTADIGTVNSMRVVRKSVLEAILGDDGFVSRFGGEINRDNFDIDMLVQQGENRDYRIIYKKNLTGLQITNDSSTVVNRIIPTYLNENNAAVLLPENYIDSALIGNTAIPHAKAIHYGDIKVGEEVDSVILYPTTADAQAEVRARVAALYAAGVDLPLLTVEIGFIQLRNTLEYADYSALEIVQLGDTIGAIYENYSWTSRVVSYDWDTLLQKYNNIILGTVRPSASDMSASISANAIAAAQESLRQRTVELTGAIASAQTTADGKNTVYYSATTPAGGIYAENDIWFDTDNGNKMYLYDGSVWSPAQFGENAIADLSITNSKIKNATIESAKIASIDAGKITTGTLNADIVNVINLNAASITTGQLSGLRIAAGAITTDKISATGISADKITSGLLSSNDGRTYFDLDNSEIKETGYRDILKPVTTTDIYYGGLSTLNGAEVVDSYSMRTLYYPASAGTVFNATGTIYTVSYFFYNVNKTLISHTPFQTANAPANTKFVRLRITNGGALATAWQGSVNGVLTSTIQVTVTMSPTKPFELSVDSVRQIYVSDNGALVTSIYDINEDGVVNEDDLEIVRAYVLNTVDRPTWLAKYPKMDVNRDGAVNSTDYSILRDYYLSLNVLPEDFTDAIYQNSWVTNSPSHYAAGYRLFGKKVMLRGLVKGGTIGTTIFTLPANMRPSKQMFISTIANNAFAVAEINPDGTVRTRVGSNAYFSLDGISFELN